MTKGPYAAPKLQNQFWMVAATVQHQRPASAFLRGTVRARQDLHKITKEASCGSLV